MLELNRLYNMDCMEGMKQFPDKYFDLAIVDPPYGIGNFNNKPIIDKRTNKFYISTSEKYKNINWNNDIPNKEYFNELLRISKNHIIWGFQHFLKNLEIDSEGIIIHDFKDQSFNMSQADIALTNLQKRITVFPYLWAGFRKEYKEPTDKNRIHPCEKPVALYKWLLKNYAKPEYKIIDTHAGSCSSVIAFLEFGCQWIAFEIDKDYYQTASKRIENYKAQLKLELK